MSMRLSTANRTAVRPAPARLAVPRITAFLNDGQEQPQKASRIGSRRQQLRAKQEGKPKQATAWTLFVNDHRATVKKELLEASQPANTAAVMKKCSKLWAAAGDEIKNPYKEAAEWRKLEIAEWNEKQSNSGAKAAVVDTARDEEEVERAAAPSVDTIEQDSEPELATAEVREEPRASFFSAHAEAGPSATAAETEPGQLSRPTSAEVESQAVARTEPDDGYARSNIVPIPEAFVSGEDTSSPAAAAAPPQPAYSSWHKSFESPGTGPEY